MRKFYITFFSLLHCILFAQGARYVDVSGVDLGDCGSVDNPCKTITYAMLQADPGDTIRISEGIFTEVDGITVDKSILLQGAGDSLTIIQANVKPEMATSRVITVDGDYDVAISGITIRYGFANNVGTGGWGGGIYCKSASLVLEDVRMYNNSAKMNGGGLACSSSTIVLSSVVFDENIAYKQAGSAGGGGGLFMINSIGSITNVDFKMNSASLVGSGGGAYLVGSLVTIDSSGFILNNADTGGGISVYAGKIILLNSYVSDNRARIGNGGGINSDSDTLILRNNFISGNYSGSSGGGLAVTFGYTEFVGDSIQFNRASSNGGGIFNTTELLKLEDVMVENNLAGTFGGGMFHSLESRYILTGITFRDNESNSFGGGFCNRGDSLFIQDVIFEQNKAQEGGGAYLIGNAVVEGCTFLKNHASYSGGGLNISGSALLSNSSFTQNTSEFGGGLSATGAHFDESYPKLSRITFSGNSAKSGGGMSSGPFCYPSLEFVGFDNNTAEYGGGFINSFGSPTLANVLFYNNTAITGGGLFNHADSVTVVNAMFIGNVASTSGGAIHNEGDENITPLKWKMKLINATISQNASLLGGGLYNMANYHVDALNTIIWDNVGDIASEIYNDSTSSALMQYCIITDKPSGVVEGDGIEFFQCIYADPMFVSSDDYRLTAGSPGINSGDPNTITGVFPGGPNNPVDYDSNQRIIGPKIDIGAFEWQVWVSLDKSDPETLVSLFPNPASNSIYISGMEPLERITIYNLIGQIVYENSKVDRLKQEINISLLPDGLYFMDISLKKSHCNYKFLKKGY